MEKDRLLAEVHVEGNHMVHYALVEDNHPVEGSLQEGIRKVGIPKEGIPKEGILKEGIPKEGIRKVGILQEGILKEGIQKVGILKVGIPKTKGHVKCLRTALCPFHQPLVVVYHLLPFFCIL
jgi:hypothetical protein